VKTVVSGPRLIEDVGLIETKVVSMSLASECQVQRLLCVPMYQYVACPQVRSNLVGHSLLAMERTARSDGKKYP
jgi:hypothetical protein